VAFVPARSRFDSATDLFGLLPDQVDNAQVISEYFACLQLQLHVHRAHLYKSVGGGGVAELVGFPVAQASF
jgi:hypothetical protein